MKGRFVLWLVVLTISVKATEIQRYDGWYNNIANPSWGVQGSHLLRLVEPRYKDGTYTYPDGPNVRNISQYAMSGPSGLPSYMNRTVFLALFGQFVSLESIKGVSPGCPRELTPLPIPKCDPNYDPTCKGTVKVPFLRAKYDKKTGNAPGYPREQTNGVSHWIDGSVIYSNSRVIVDSLRSFKDGKLRTRDGEGMWPPINDPYMPVLNLPPSREHTLFSPERHWLTGDGRLFQHPAMLAFYVLFMRYHNHKADQYKEQHPDWDDEQLFQATRRWVIAVEQKIYAYDFFEAFTNDTVPSYSGYKRSVHPGISHLYQSAAFRFGHTVVPPGFYRRDTQCNFYTTTEKTGHAGKPAVRMCNSWFHGDEAFEFGFEPVILGMASQLTEREDHILNDDVRVSLFGPLQHSRRDLTMVNIQRGRDNGFPDYNTARKELGLEQKKNFSDINPWMYSLDPEPFHRLEEVYEGNIDNVDIFVGGLFESTPEGPGELFRFIIKDQFTRLRDGDRFWFENTLNGLFTNEDISEIRNTTLYDIIMKVTKIQPGEIQKNVFFHYNSDPCPQPIQLNGSDMEPCNNNQGYDFFQGSEIAYIVIISVLAAFPLLCLIVPEIWVIIRRKKYARSAFNRSLIEKTFSGRSFAGEVHSEALEFVEFGKWREVEVVHTSKPAIVKILDMTQQDIRWLRLDRMNEIKIRLGSDAKHVTMCIENKKGTDMVLSYKNAMDCTRLCLILEKYAKDNNIKYSKLTTTEKTLLSEAVTRAKLISDIETYLRDTFAELFGIIVQNRTTLKYITKQELMEMELNRTDFAEAIRLTYDSAFVELMFTSLDKENTGLLSVCRFMAMLVLISDVSTKKKLKVLFSMYDVRERGKVDKTVLLEVIREIEKLAETSGENDDVMYEAMLMAAGLDEKQDYTFDDLLTLSEQDERIQENMTKAAEKLEGAYSPLPTTCSASSRPMTVTKIRYRQPSVSASSTATEDSFERAAKPVKPINAAAKWWRHAQKFLANNRLHIFYLLLFYLISAAVFIERAYHYAVEKEHSGIRKITGHGVTITRGAASAMSFTYSVVLLTMCKNTLNMVRSTWIAHWIPIDAAFAFHKIAAYTSVIITVCHVAGHGINFYHISTQPPDFVECIFKNMIWFRSDYLPSFSFWMFLNPTGLTGVFLVLTVSTMVVFASPWVRHRLYHVFYAVHSLYIAFYTLVIIHGSAELVQQPWFHYFFLGPAVLFVGDKLYGMKRTVKPLDVIEAKTLPSGVLYLKVEKPEGFKFIPGQFARVACDGLSKREFHPFVITSTEADDYLSFHIRALGPWTTGIADAMISSQQTLPKIYVDGPYGGVSNDWQKYEISVLFAGGIGVTAFSTILKQLLRDKQLKSGKGTCKKIYFVWSTKGQNQWEWFFNDLIEIEEADLDEYIDIHLFITHSYESYDLRTLLMFLSEKHLLMHGISDGNLFTGLQSPTHFGRPDFSAILQVVTDHHPEVEIIGVFAAGPPVMTRAVHKACSDQNRNLRTSFEFYGEAFSG